jgi:hypothetical protein
MLHAQDWDVSLLISGIASQPTGDYGEELGENAKLTRRYGFDIGNDVGLAKTGLGIGIELYSPVITEGLGWIFDIRYIANPTESATAEAYFQELLGSNSELVYETGTWINIPIMTGFRYKYFFSSNFSASLFVQAGINLSQNVYRKGSNGDVTGEDTTFKFARDFGYELGLGVDLFQNFNIGISYIDLGKPRYEGTRTLSENVFPEIFSRENHIIGEDRSVSMFLISFGYYIL